MVNSELRTVNGERLYIVCWHNDLSRAILFGSVLQGRQHDRVSTGEATMIMNMVAGCC